MGSRLRVLVGLARPSPLPANFGGKARSRICLVVHLGIPNLADNGLIAFNVFSLQLDISHACAFTYHLLCLWIINRQSILRPLQAQYCAWGSPWENNPRNTRGLKWSVSDFPPNPEQTPPQKCKVGRVLGLAPTYPEARAPSPPPDRNQQPNLARDP